MRHFAAVEEWLEPLLRCPECLGEMEWQALDGVCRSCRHPARRFESGSYVFLPAENVTTPPPLTKDPTDDTAWSDWRRKNFDYLKTKMADVAPGSLVLDVGAGAGYFRTLYRDHRYVGVDFTAYESVNVVADITSRLPVADGVADVAVLSNVLEHVPTPERLLAECRRVLRPGGATIVLVPFLIRVHEPPFDFLRYTRYMIERLFEQTGYRDAQVEEIGDIFDVHRTLLVDLTIVLARNAGRRHGEADGKNIRKHSISPFRKSVDAQLRALRELCGDDISVLGAKQYPQGYGAVAYA